MSRHAAEICLIRLVDGSHLFNGKYGLLQFGQAKGYLSKLPHYNSIFNYLESAELTPILRSLITETSLPLKAVETDFAVDSSGFSTSRFTRWFDHKYGAVRQKQDWIKLHLMCGVRTNIVTAVEIRGKNAADTTMLAPLVDATAKNFELSEVSADRAYGSRLNYKAKHNLINLASIKSRVF